MSDRMLRLFDLQRFCVHDGPGIRTVVFLKGCPLRCRWCQNPESLSAQPEVAFYPDRCAGCLACVDACPNAAARAGEDRIDRSRCQACGSCAEACPHEALRLVGWSATPREVLARVDADRPYYHASGGGVTLSGGEPLLQTAPVAELLSLCRRQGIHTVIETSGAVPWTSFDRVMPWVDLFYFDLKAHGDGLHQEITGCAAEPIVRNAERLVSSDAKVVFRMPVIPGLNDSADSVDGIAALLQRLGQRSVVILPYHRAGEDKIDRIASAQPRLAIAPADAEQALERAAARLRTAGLEVVIEGSNGRPPAPRERRTFPDRVWRLRAAVQSHTPEICAERALLVTGYFKDRAHRTKPVIIQKAEALRHVLRRRSVMIHDDELLVGCFSSTRVGGSIYPELHGVAVMQDLLSFGSRQVNPLRIEPRARRALALKVLPFWLTRFLAYRAFSLPKTIRFVLDQLGGRRYLINETGGISHLVPDYAELLARGTSGIAAEARERAAATTDPACKDFYRAVEIACEGLEAMASRYESLARTLAADEADVERRADLETIACVCSRIPRLPAETLHEAFQALLFAQIAINLESLDNAVSPGRLDQILEPYYRADLAAGRSNEHCARELVGCFTVKMSEIVPVFSRRITRFHGGMFNGQAVVVGGTDRAGNDATNVLTWVFLDAMDELRMRQPNYHARIHAASPSSYVERIAGMLRDGSGAPSLMNDQAVVPMLVGRGTALDDARDYSPVGCIEPVACGASFASTDAALVNLALCLERALGTKAGGARTRPASGCGSIDELVDLFRIQVDHLVDELMVDLQAIEQANAEHHPTPLTSMLLRGCLESGVDSTAGGATYNGSGIQGVGIADIADSLAAVEDVVFRRQLCTAETLVAALRADFSGHDALRGHLLGALKFGNDNPEVDGFADRVMAVFADSLARHTSARGGPYFAGFYSVTAHTAFGDTTGALPSGRRAGRPLAAGLSPANGCDRLGPTAALNSSARLDVIGRALNGVNVNLKLDRATLGGACGIDALAGLVQGYFRQGGMQVQTNIIDPDLLLRARDDPESHPWLLVRVSGYSAYFNDLSPEMKQEIIDRTRHGG